MTKLTLALISSSLVSTSLASWEKIRDAFEAMEIRAMENGTAFLNNDGVALDRQFSGLIGSFMVDISNYGCWCYLDGGYHGQARGQPKDWIDSQCKRLVNGYKCAGMDAQARGETCEAHTVDYNAYDYFSAMQPIDVECAQLNSDLCQEAACIVEAVFVMDFFPQFFGGIQYDPQFQHPVVGGSFDTSVECPYGNGAGKQADTDRECCGEYLTGRAPFKTRNRQCCGVELINPLNSQCCNDIAQPVGAVCL